MMGVIISHASKAMWQDRWQCIHGALVIGVPGSDSSHSANVQTSKEIGNTLHDITEKELSTRSQDATQ